METRRRRRCHLVVVYAQKMWHVSVGLSVACKNGFLLRDRTRPSRSAPGEVPRVSRLHPSAPPRRGATSAEGSARPRVPRGTASFPSLELDRSRHYVTAWSTWSAVCSRHTVQPAHLPPAPPHSALSLPARRVRVTSTPPLWPTKTRENPRFPTGQLAVAALTRSRIGERQSPASRELGVEQRHRG